MSNITTSKFENRANRSAGTGVILAGSEPIKRGIWDIYETTNPLIGLFDRSFWIEFNFNNLDVRKFKSNISVKSIEAFSHFVDKNFKDNLIFMEWSSIKVMGGVGSIKGKQVAGKVYRREKKAKEQGLGDQNYYPMVSGYELRTSQRDAVTFLTLWQGYDGT